MDWDDLRLFLAVARAESLSGAGRQLRLDPATLGRRIARLEQAVEAGLFIKSPQGYSLTEAGSRLLVHAQRAEAALEAAAEDLSGAAAGLSGQIRIGAPDGCANYLLPQVLTRICTENPGLEVQVVALPRVFNLSRREADMAIGVSRPETGRLKVQKLTDYRLCLAASEGYLKGVPPLRSRADLGGHRLVGYIPDMIFDKELDYLSELDGGRLVLSSNSVSVQLRLLQAGAGIGFVHDFALPAACGLVRLLPQTVSLKRSFWLIRHAADGRQERLDRFAALLTEAVRREIARLEALA